MSVERRAAPEKTTRYPGFDKHGQFFWSESPVENGPTHWVRDTCRRIHDELMTPADIVDSLRTEHPSIQSLLSNDTISDWCRYDRYHLWPLVKAPSVLTQTLKHQGKGKPPWNDDNAWTGICDASEARHCQASRFTEPTDPEALLSDLTLSLGGTR